VIGSPLEKVGQIATLDLSITELEDLAAKNGKADQQFYVRVVPLDANHGCAAAPTKSIQVHLHDNYPQEKAEYDQILAENKAKAPFAANDGRGGAPFNVLVSTYVPFNLDDPAMYRIPTQVLETRITSDQLNTLGIKHGGDWEPGCAFDPGYVQTWARTDHSNLDSTLEKIWDDALEAVEMELTECHRRRQHGKFGKQLSHARYHGSNQLGRTSGRSGGATTHHRGDHSAAPGDVGEPVLPTRGRAGAIRFGKRRRGRDRKVGPTPLSRSG
jgi:hypothetical protein